MLLLRQLMSAVHLLRCEAVMQPSASTSG